MVTWHTWPRPFFRWLLLLRLFVTCFSLSFRHLFSKVAKGVLVDLDLFLPPVLYRTITKNKNIDWICTDVITLTHAYGRCSEWSNIQVTLSNSHLQQATYTQLVVSPVCLFSILLSPQLTHQCHIWCYIINKILSWRCLCMHILTID